MSAGGTGNPDVDPTRRGIPVVQVRDLPEGAVYRGRSRRRPKLLPFLFSGAGLGMLLGLVLSSIRPDAAMSSPAQQYIVTMFALGLLGGLLGAVVFLVLEWWKRRR